MTIGLCRRIVGGMHVHHYARYPKTSGRFRSQRLNGTNSQRSYDVRLLVADNGNDDLWAIGRT